MSHVFISYSSKHPDLTQQLAAFLEAAGLEVWWDRELAARGPFKDQIHDKLATAGAVVVLWTPPATISEWVIFEAEYALKRDMLVNVVTEAVTQEDLPSPFNMHERHRPFETALILRDVLAVRQGRLLLDDRRSKLPPIEMLTPSALLHAKYNIVPFTDEKGHKI